MSEFYAQLRIRSKPREGFRKASAAYVLKELSYQSSKPEGEIQARINDLAARMSVSSSELQSEINEALLPALRNLIAPGEGYPEAEFDKHKGKFDLQSLLCNVMPFGSIVDRLTLYENTLSHVLKRRINVVHYMGTSKEDEDVIVNKDNQLNALIHEKEKSRKLYYMTTINDKIIESDVLRIKSTDNREVVPYDVIKLNGTSTTSFTQVGKRVTFTINLNQEQVDEKRYTPDVNFNDMIMSLEKCTSIEIFRDNKYVIVPFVIENEGLNDGTLIIHVFFDNDSNSKALQVWMDYCFDLLKNMYKSLLRTISDNQDEAFYAANLGGQFPVDMFRSLRGTLSALSGERFTAMPIHEHFKDMLLELTRGLDAFNSSTTMISKAFGSYHNLRAFHENLFAMLSMIMDFNDLVTYRKMTDKEKREATSDMILYIKNSHPNEILGRYREMADNDVSGMIDSDEWQSMLSKILDRVNILTSYLY
jgi:hypothetical protein